MKSSPPVPPAPKIKSQIKPLYWFFVVFALGTALLACSQTTRLPFLGPTPTPTSSPTATPLPATPTPTPTPTPPPTPTPQPAARLDKADQALFYGDWEAALREYQTALAASEDPAIQSAALLGIGRTQVSSGDYTTAVDSLNRLLREFPNSPQIPYTHFALAQAYTTLGRHIEAADAYLAYLTLKSGLVDGYILNLRGDALRAGGDIPGAIQDYRAALQSPSTLDGIQIEIKIGQAHSAAGDQETALAIYEGVYDRTSSDAVKAQMDFLKGQAYTALGRMDEAYISYQDAVSFYPRAYSSYLSLLELVNAGVPVDELQRGIVDYYAGQYGVALAAFDRYFQGNPTDPATARYFNGLSIRALGGHLDAVAEWDKVIQNYPDSTYWDDAWEQKAYTQWAFLDDYESAIQTLLDFVAAVPNHPRAGEYLFDAASAAERDNRLEQAVEIWERVASEYPGYIKAQRSLHLAGVALFRLQDYNGGVGVFQRGLSTAVTLEERAAAYLWLGKCQAALGEQEAAETNWQQAALADPTGYYSERALDILRGNAPFTPPEAFDLAIDLATERARAEDWMRTSFNLPEGSDLSTPGTLLEEHQLRRGAELWKLGLYEEARLEFENLRQSIQNDPVANYHLANYLVNLGLYRTAILSARQVLNLAGMSDADTMNAPFYFNYIRFGPYFSEIIIPTAQDNDFHPLMLFSLVRQESAFEGFVRSSAGARGLMQIIPTTGQEIAAQLGWPPEYSDEDLYRPLVSVVLGAEYLRTWRERLSKNTENPQDTAMYAALAAYNGGPGNAIQWQAIAPNDPDLFLEIIRFEETRNYIDGIYELFNIYRRLYDRSP